MLEKRRFWKDAVASECQGGFEILLDGRHLKTPAKSALVMPNAELAEAVAAEWRAQEKFVNPKIMPATRFVNSAIDKVAPQFDEVAAMLAAYAGSDLICYRATDPTALTNRQAAAWDPLISWADEELDLSLKTTKGIMPVEQAKDIVPKAKAALERLTPFALAAMHDLICLSGSFVIGQSVARRLHTAEDAWQLARIDENFQIELWGEDQEAAISAKKALEDFNRAAKFFHLCNG